MSEKITKMLHDAYERHALTNGWETQVASRKHWEDVPEANRNTMLAMVEEIIPDLMKEAYYVGYELGLDKRPPWFDKWYEANYAE